MLTCQQCNCSLQDPFGRVKETCDRCGWIATSEQELQQDTGPVATADEVTITGRGTEFLCPACIDSNLNVATILRTQVCCCPQCQGFLVDSETLGMLIQTLRATYSGAEDRPVVIDQNDLRKTLNCPTCCQTMFTHPYHGPGNAVINSCNTCKLSWFDAGEFATIIRAPGLR